VPSDSEVLATLLCADKAAAGKVLLPASTLAEDLERAVAESAAEYPDEEGAILIAPSETQVYLAIGVASALSSPWDIGRRSPAGQVSTRQCLQEHTPLAVGRKGCWDQGLNYAGPLELSSGDLELSQASNPKPNWRFKSGCSYLYKDLLMDVDPAESIPLLPESTPISDDHLCGEGLQLFMQDIDFLGVSDEEESVGEESDEDEEMSRVSTEGSDKMNRSEAVAGMLKHSSSVKDRSGKCGGSSLDGGDLKRHKSGQK
jgi:hypothetical protein